MSQLARLIQDDRFTAIVVMFQKELVAKNLIVHDILNCNDRNQSTTYIASWQMEPQIDKQDISDMLMVLLRKSDKF